MQDLEALKATIIEQVQQTDSPEVLQWIADCLKEKDKDLTEAQAAELLRRHEQRHLMKTYTVKEMLESIRKEVK